MRKLILFAVVFLLLAAPAWADDIDVQVTVGSFFTWTCDDTTLTAAITAVNTWTDLTDGTSTGIDYTFSSNCPWTADANYTSANWHTGLKLKLQSTELVQGTVTDFYSGSIGSGSYSWTAQAKADYTVPPAATGSEYQTTLTITAAAD